MRKSDLPHLVLDRPAVRGRVDIDGYLKKHRPDLPVYFSDAAQAGQNARRFLAGFAGTTMYAVKCNPDADLIRAMLAAGIDAFDCASLSEVALVRSLSSTAKIYFMHPIKSRASIRAAYHQHHVRAFVLDSADELYKIVQETDLATDLELFVRVALPKGRGAAISLSGKFGADPEAAVQLLRDARAVAARLGISFHVGSECRRPQRYAEAIKHTAALLERSGVKLDALDVGGGFPAGYPNIQTPDLETYFTVIAHAVARQSVLSGVEMLCEPGRALVANTAHLAVRVMGRKGDVLYLNDGVYGNLIEMGPASDFVLPHRLLRPVGRVVKSTMLFVLMGPTCDSYDRMRGPFMLPVDVAEGDYIVFSHTGAYSTSSQTNFNGFGQTDMVRV